MSILSLIFGTNKLPPVLKATITFDVNNNASVQLEKLHPQTPIFEYIKIVLMMYAKMLANLDPNDNESFPASQLLITAMKNIAKAKLKSDSNILKLANIDDVVNYTTPKGKTFEIVATLFAPSGIFRHIKTDIQWGYTLQQTIFSVPVLIQEIIKFLGVEEIRILQRALDDMNQHYESGFNYNDLRTWSSIPNNAFFSAFSTEGNRPVKI